MDSGNEMQVAEEVNGWKNSTNGHPEPTVNGSADEHPEMKTRSKVVKNVAAAQSSAEKSGSDSEGKKDRKLSKEIANLKSSTLLGVGDSVVKVTATPPKKNSKSSFDDGLTPSKKRGTQDKDEDSGINSRASSVSNDEAPRMRTRSSRATAEMASSGSTLDRKSEGRVPISSYDFDISLDDTLNGPNSLKRKATTVFVEEMDEFDDTEDVVGNGPTQAKRPTLAPPGFSFFRAFLYPFKAVRGKLYPDRKRDAEERATIEEQLVTSEENVELVLEESIDASETEEAGEVVASGGTSRTCAIM